MQQILKANELPPGARLMGRQGKALTGLELASGLVALVEREAGELAAIACSQQIERGWWARMNLTFPKARLEWTPAPEGIWVRLVLHGEKDWTWEWQSKGADIRELVSMGPFASPDDFREALGLPRTAQFQLPGGEVVTAEMPGAALRQADPGDQALRQRMLEEANEAAEAKVVREEAMAAIERMAAVKAESDAARAAAKPAFEPVINPLTGEPIAVQGGFVKEFTKPAELASEELLAEPPRVEPVSEPVEKVEPKFGKGSRGKKGAKNGTN